jgi:hypothetical protein
MRVSVFSTVLVLCCPSLASAQLGEILKKAGETLEHRDTSGLGDGRIIAGLKQALEVSTVRPCPSPVNPTVS